VAISLGQRGGPALALVLYLILTRSDATDRDVLIDVLGTEKSALTRDQLRRYVHDLRSIFGQDAIIGESTLQWMLPVAVDAEELMELTQASLPDDTLRLYQADFLSGWEKVKHAPRLQTWMAGLRETFRRHAFALLDDRAKAAEEAREWERVGAIGARMHALWPGLEEGHFWEIRALEELEQYTQASERYADAERSLDNAGKSVSAALAELANRIQRRRDEEMARRAAESRDGGLTEPAPEPPPDETRPVVEEGPARTRPRRVPAWLAGVLAAGFVGVLALAFWPDQGGRPGARTYPVCRNGTGRAALIREIYQKRRGVNAGAQFTKGWVLRNEGPCRWEKNFRIVRQRDPGGAGPHYIVASDTVLLDKEVLPNDTVGIFISMRAPDVHDYVRDLWSLLDPTGGSVTTEQSPYLSVDLIVRKPPYRICSPDAIAADFVVDGHEDRQVLPPGQAFTGSWSLINPRLCAWPPDVKLQRKESSDSALSGPTKFVLAGDTVLPGDPMTFRVSMHAPHHPDTYTEEWELITNSATGPKVGSPIVPPIRIRVAPPGEAAQLRAPRCGPREAQAAFVSETIRDSTRLHVEQEFTKVWTLANRGTCRWERPMALRFAGSSGVRMSLVEEVAVEGVVLPEKSYSFVVSSRTPPQPGTYTEFWQLRIGEDTIDVPNLGGVSMTVVVK
jgi:DNA-binding SARP family transcriptional activator